MRPANLPSIGETVVGRYRIVSKLGQGGMGAVFVVERLHDGGRFAMKMLLPGLETSRELVLRFEREAKAASLLDHPHIVDVLDFGALPDGTLFLVMELVEGRPLGQVIDEGSLRPSRALSIARQILDGLSHAHDAGIIHRDIKADNIMLTSAAGPDPGVKILDFGIAKVVGDAAAAVGGEKLTQAGMVFGSPDYLSPEQAFGLEVDARADLYSVGVLLFEMLTHRLPFIHEDPIEVVRMQARSRAPSLSEATRGRLFTREIEHVVARALAKTPNERFGSAREMIAAIDAALASLSPRAPSPAFAPPPAARPASSVPRGAPPAAPRAMLFIIAGVVLLVLVTMLAVIAAQ